MNGKEIETYFLWLTEAEQSDLFNSEDAEGVLSSICESVMEPHESSQLNYDYIEKPSPEYPGDETTHIASMHPETTNPGTTYSFNSDMISPNLFYNPPDINQQYQTMDQNTTEFSPMYYENHSKDVTPVNPFTVPNTVMNSSPIVPSTMNYMASDTSPVTKYGNLQSLSNEIELVPQNPEADYTIPTDQHVPLSNVVSDTPLEDSHLASVLLNVPLEQLANEAISEQQQQQLHAEPVNFNSVSQEESMIADDTNVDFNSERLNIDDSNMSSDYQPSLDTSEYNDESSQNMVIDENPQLSINYEAVDQTDQTVPPNEILNTSNCVSPKHESFSSACVTSEITIDESQPNHATEIAPDVDVRDENTNSNEENEEPQSRTEIEEESNEVAEQVNGTTFDAENEVSSIQMCIRNGCANPAVNNPEWEQEFCCNDCVVIHCRNVFDAWVEANAIMGQ